MIHVNKEVLEFLDHEMITVNNEDRVLAPLLILLLEFHKALFQQTVTALVLVQPMRTL